MRSLIDCPSCACLIEGRETACPFCGAVVRSASMPMWLALGLVLGVGVADVSCGGKGDGGDEETSIASGVTYAGPDTSYSGSGDTDTGDTTSSSPDASGVTYAGPDETWTASEATTTTGSSGSTGSTTDATTSGTSSTGATDSSTGSSTGSSGDASTYAGPDETSTTGP